MNAETVLTALAPYSLYIALAGIFGLFYVEARGAWGRAGTTAHRSGLGAGASFALLILLSVYLVASGWTALGGLLLALTVVVVIVWAASSAGRRSSLRSSRRAVVGKRRRAPRASRSARDLLVEGLLIVVASVLSGLLLALLFHVPGG